MKTYIKYLLKLYSFSFLKVFFIFFGIILILNILDQSNFFKDLKVHFLFPVLLSFLNTPSTIFEILPFIFLISTQFFFIKLIDSYELEIFKYSGLDNLKIVKIISLLSFVFGIFIIIFYYSASSLMKSSYLSLKSKYTDDNKYLAVVTENGLWIKDEIKESIKIINANNIDEQFLNEVLIFQFNKNFELLETIESKKVDVSTNTWRLIDPIIFRDNSQIQIKEMFLNSNFDLKKIKSLFSNLSSLTIYDLIKLRKSYKSLNYSLIEVDAHLIKIVSYPFYLTLITVLTSIIMFNIGFRKDTLFKIILGIFLSVTIYYINYFFNVLGTSEKIPLMLSIWFPLIILSIINATFIVRLNEK
tara:strand:+ start:1959 stop:3032 length:1074 start_codon:yes stop_codon:yes gene_type:complete